MSDVAPTPVETVVALLEQGRTPEEVIAEAEATISEHEEAAGAVTFFAVEVSGRIGGALLAARAALAALAEFPPGDLGRAETILDGRLHPGKDSRVVRAVHAHRQAEEGVTIAEGDAEDAARAAEHFCAHTAETVANARARLAAARDPEVVGPAVQRYKDSKKAEAAALKAEK